MPESYANKSQYQVDCEKIFADIFQAKDIKLRELSIKKLESYLKNLHVAKDAMKLKQESFKTVDDNPEPTESSSDETFYKREDDNPQSKGFNFDEIFKERLEALQKALDTLNKVQLSNLFRFCDRGFSDNNKIFLSLLISESLCSNIQKNNNFANELNNIQISDAVNGIKFFISIKYLLSMDDKLDKNLKNEIISICDTRMSNEYDRLSDVQKNTLLKNSSEIVSKELKIIMDKKGNTEKGPTRTLNENSSTATAIKQQLKEEEKQEPVPEIKGVNSKEEERTQEPAPKTSDNDVELGKTFSLRGFKWMIEQKKSPKNTFTSPKELFESIMELDDNKNTAGFWDPTRNDSLTEQINKEIYDLKKFLLVKYRNPKDLEKNNFNNENTFSDLVQQLAVASASIKYATLEADADKGSRYFDIQKIASKLPEKQKKMFREYEIKAETALYHAKFKSDCFDDQVLSKSVKSPIQMAKESTRIDKDFEKKLHSDGQLNHSEEDLKGWAKEKVLEFDYGVRQRNKKLAFASLLTVKAGVFYGLFCGGKAIASAGSVFKFFATLESACDSVLALPLALKNAFSKKSNESRFTKKADGRYTYTTSCYDYGKELVERPNFSDSARMVNDITTNDADNSRNKSNSSPAIK